MTGVENVQPIAGVSQLTKRFGAITALDDVTMSFMPGEVHGLVGANGAGKSTLVKMLAGVYQPDEGQVFIQGEPVRLSGPLDARDRGLGFIFQELALVPRFSILQNLALGQWETNKAGIVRWKPVRERAKVVMDRIGLERPLDTQVRDLSVAEAWLVIIARALMYDAELLFMDEPTASLSAKESNRLFEVIRSLSQTGVSLVYITHRLDEVVQLCSRVSVFRDGKLVASLDDEQITKDELVAQIVGPARSIAGNQREIRPVSIAGDIMFSCTGIARAPMVHGVDLEVRAGEVVGIAGLVGSGRTEFARMIFGSEKPQSGTMVLDGKPYAPKDVYDAIRHGVALVPEERRSQGLILARSVQLNITLPTLKQLCTAALGLLSMTKAQRNSERMIDELGIKTPSAAAPAQQLSGGNQQKVVMGKWLLGTCKLLVLDEPSRGVDIAARWEIYRLIRERADQGTAAIVISSEFEELEACDRVIIMYEGQVVGELHHNDINEQAILEIIFAAPTLMKEIL